MPTYENLPDLFKAMGNSIRKKKGTTALIKPVDFPAEIDSIPTGGGIHEWGNIRA